MLMPPEKKAEESILNEDHLTQAWNTQTQSGTVKRRRGGEIQDPHLEDLFRYTATPLYRRARREEVIRFGEGTYRGVRVDVGV